MRRIVPAALFIPTALFLTAHGCVFSNSANHCPDDKIACPANGAGGATATSSTGPGTGAAGGGGKGGGGSAPCGGNCKDPTPLCDTSSMKCVACLADGDCKDAANAHCSMGACVPCMTSDQCKSHTGVTSCDMGKCVECKLGEETACTGANTCDLTGDKCVATPAGSVTSCGACTNDVQCEMGAACIAMDFNKQPHGYFCLKAANPTCPQQQFQVAINKPSISGKSATDYCGIDQDRTTCEAVLALLNAWVCSGMDGKCGPQGMPEVSVPGALCKQVGLAPNKCTYACGLAAQCPSDPPVNTCGVADGQHMPPGWCGG